MEEHEKRNELPPLTERPIELLIYGRFVEHESDKGFYSDVLAGALGRPGGNQPGDGDGGARVVPRRPWTRARRGPGGSRGGRVA